MTLAQLEKAKYEEEQVKIGDYRISVIRDEDSGNSREWDNLATMYCKHSRYTLGDEKIPDTYYDSELGEDVDIDSEESFLEWLRQEGEKVLLVKPLTLYDHSGLVMHIGTPQDRWDSGIVGWIVVTEKQADMIGVTDRSEDNLLKGMQAEVETYNQDLSGDIWGYRVEKGKECESCGHAEYEEIDSVWGFYDDESLLEAINNNLEG